MKLFASLCECGWVIHLANDLSLAQAISQLVLQIPHT